MTPTLPPSHDQARCMHPPFAECYAIQAFSIASDFDSQLMPKDGDIIFSARPTPVNLYSHN